MKSFQFLIVENEFNKVESLLPDSLLPGNHSYVGQSVATKVEQLVTAYKWSEELRDIQTDIIHNQNAVIEVLKKKLKEQDVSALEILDELEQIKAAI